MKQKGKYSDKQVRALTLDLSQEQREQIADFWRETGSLGGVEILVDVVDDKISPASIQVGTAR